MSILAHACARGIFAHACERVKLEASDTVSK